jgi:hypothetical protein
VICLTDTEQGIRAAREAGVQPVLMMNDPTKPRLTAFNPASGIIRCRSCLISCSFYREKLD